jgi:hypothetical protein
MSLTLWPMRIIASAAAFLALSATTAAPSESARFQFCWIGANGFTMEGIIGFPGKLLGTGIITQADVTEFRIWGYHNGAPVGSWSMAQRTTETSWTLFFDTDAIAFPMGGHFPQSAQGFLTRRHPGALHLAQTAGRALELEAARALEVELLRFASAEQISRTCPS